MIYHNLSDNTLLKRVDSSVMFKSTYTSMTNINNTHYLYLNKIKK